MKKMMLRRKSLAKMFLAIAILFAVFEGPYFTTYLYFSLGFRIARNPIAVGMIVELLQTVRTLMYPLVYLTHARTFHRSISVGAGVGGRGADSGGFNCGEADKDNRDKSKPVIFDEVSELRIVNDISRL